jgi:hypothetical protein
MKTTFAILLFSLFAFSVFSQNKKEMTLQIQLLEEKNKNLEIEIEKLTENALQSTNVLNVVIKELQELIEIRDAEIDSLLKAIEAMKSEAEKAFVVCEDVSTGNKQGKDEWVLHGIKTCSYKKIKIEVKTYISQPPSEEDRPYDMDFKYQLLFYSNNQYVPVSNSEIFNENSPVLLDIVHNKIIENERWKDWDVNPVEYFNRNMKVRINSIKDLKFEVV